METMALRFILCCLAVATVASACGVPDIPPVISGYPTHIVGGEEALAHSWPWQVSLQNPTGHHFCSGILINESWVVTAAHCPVEHCDRIILGEHDRSSNSEDIQTIEVGRFFKHPQYNQPWLNNDIALIKLASPAKLGKHVSPVCLAETSDNFPGGMMCVTSGWSDPDRLQPVWLQQRAARLHQGTLPLLSNEECNAYFSDSSVTEQEICAGANGFPTCCGDSGSPLVCEKNGAWTLVGVVSWVLEYCWVDCPIGYARITELRAWMDQTIAAN